MTHSSLPPTPVSSLAVQTLLLVLGNSTKNKGDNNDSKRERLLPCVYWGDVAEPWTVVLVL